MQPAHFAMKVTDTNPVNKSIVSLAITTNISYNLKTISTNVTEYVIAIYDIPITIHDVVYQSLHIKLKFTG